MSGTKRRSESTAIAIFPFLAVLLCTVGALVLILIVTVSNSRSSAKRNTEAAMEELKDASNLMQVVSEELEAQRESLKAKVEHRRRDLTDIEDHIARLTKTFEQLTAKIDLIQSEASQSDTSRIEKSTEISALRKEIDQKKRDLMEEIEKQKNRKPAFAVIPYVGPNGTSRRPVYLECTEKGVLIQPEGIMISLNDLKPPFGPGNPLDAALRVLRHAYQQTDLTFGITQPPYPLLIVRPDGIKTYALALEAMRGWDDQYGYELVDSDMDLTFPLSPAGLKEQLTSAVEIAKRRQQALIASMPRRMVSDSDDGWDVIDDSNASHQANEEGSSNSGGNSTTERNDGRGFSNGNGTQQNWQLVQGMANSQVSGAIQKNGLESSQSVGTSGKPGLPGNPSGAPIPNAFGMGFADLNGQYGISDSQNASSQLAMQQQGSTNGSNPNGQITSEGQFRSGASSQVANSAGDPQGSASSASGTQGGTSSSTGEASPSGTNTGNNSTASSSSAGSNGQAGSNAPTPPGANAFSSGSATGGGTSGMQSAGGPAQPTSPDGSTAPNLSVNLDKTIPSQTKAKHVRPEGDLKPISVSAGHGWAASRAEGKATPVSRPINMVALKDRWLLRSDVDQNAFDLSVTMEAGPQQAGNQLAVALRKRVDSWGLSLPGGYWSPTLTIEAANDAQQSVARLEKLLEGSGVEIKVVTLKLPNRR